ncbi:hydrogenase maturation protease [Dactylosporangium sp. NPDC048998]|uniref:hydrogenase maturation protease n=1 Tax=Dactylosporangium sp. NPDC048998 TaxID=3363976 RepID=UPI00371F17C8
MARAALRPPVVVIGVGNPYRRDDGVGPAVIDRLRAAGLPGATLAESDGEGCALILLWERRRLAVLVDAVHAQPAHPGRIHRLVVPWPAPPHPPGTSTHTGGMGDTVSLARELDRLPERMVVFGVEAAETGLGAGLTPEVARAADRVAEEIAAEVRALQPPPQSAAGDPPPGRDRRP